ncbi:MAG: metallophosphoesterase [Clostridia bacterium]|nr:metallophosphoesterase [Clostridia bacterium]
MSDYTDRLTDLYFEDLPNNREVGEAKRKVRLALSEEGKALSFEQIVARYPSLDSLGALGGFLPERIAEWRKRSARRDVVFSLIRLIVFFFFSLVFWLFVLFGTNFLWDELTFPSSPFWWAVGGYGVVCGVFGLRMGKRRLKHGSMAKKCVAVFLVLLLLYGCYALMTANLWYPQPYINSVPSVAHVLSPIEYDEANGVFSITSKGDLFKILHLTDIHLGGSVFSRTADVMALKACYAEIEYTKPDLVIVTGDLCSPMGVMSLSLNNYTPIHQFAAFMRNIGIPWAFTYGNHDTERFASINSDVVEAEFKTLSFKTSGTLLYPYVQPTITGRNNQLIEIKNADGTLNNALFLLDSNAYTGEGLNAYDYIHDDQVDWYASEIARLEEREGRQIASLAFFHIPLTEYRIAYDLYRAGSDEATYHFGKIGETAGGRISCSEYDSRLFDTMVALGSTKGAFCGHDHYNNLSVTYRGIRLTYGMSIDYLVMPGISRNTEQRGAELITLHPDSSWDLEQIPLTSIS